MIHYLTGDATVPQGNGLKVIAHIVNNAGAWGAGFVLALNKRWLQPKAVYQKDIRECRLVLGKTQFVEVEQDIIVANMCAQLFQVGPTQIPLQYDMLKKCLKTVNKFCKEKAATVHGPRFGSGLAGGSWDKVEDLIKKHIEVDVFIYDLPPKE